MFCDMKTGLLLLTLLAAPAGKKSKTYDFDKAAAGKPPAGFSFARTKNLGKPGKWQVEAHPGAPSGGKALGQIDKDDTNARYPMAVVTAVWPADVRVSVKCKTVFGEVDQACGLVLR